MIPNQWRRWLVIVLVISSMALLIFAILGAYARPQNDDYYYLADQGLTPHDNFNWRSNGRLASLAAYYILYPLPHILQIAPGLTILLFVASLTVFLSATLTWMSVRKKTEDLWLIAATIACCTALSMLLMLPGIYATFYWFAAIPPHAWSFCFTLLYVGILFHRLLVERWPIYLDGLLFFVFPFFVGTFYEAASLILICVSFIALILTYRQKILGSIRVAWASMAASLMSLGFLFLSPGALRRRELSAGTSHDTMFHRLTQLPDVIFHNYFVTMPRYLQHPELLLILLAAGTVIGLFFIPRKVSLSSTVKRSVLTAVGSLIFISIDMCVVWIGLNETQTVREYLSVVIGLGLGALLLGIIFGQYSSGVRRVFRRGFIAGSAVAVLIVLPIINLVYIPEIRTFRGGIINYAHLWDKRDKYIRAQAEAGVCRIHTYALLINGSWYMKKAGKDNWVGSGAMHHYYKLAGNQKAWCGVYSTSNIKIWDVRYYEDPSG